MDHEETKNCRDCPMKTRDPQKYEACRENLGFDPKEMRLFWLIAECDCGK
jgi:hypothetical protein